MDTTKIYFQSIKCALTIIGYSFVFFGFFFVACLSIVHFFYLIPNCLFTKFGLIIEIHVFVCLETIKSIEMLATLTFRSQLKIIQIRSLKETPDFYWTRYQVKQPSTEYIGLHCSSSFWWFFCSFIYKFLVSLFGFVQIDC